MENEVRGPVMLAATSVLKQAPARISRLGAGIQLPRTVPIKTLIVCGITGLLAVVLTGSFLGYHLRGVLIAGVLGGAVGWCAVTYQPMRGETLMKWVGLEVLSFKDRRVKIDGKRARAYVGICPVETIARGRITIAHGHAEVAPGSVDERGGVVPLSERRGGLLLELGRRDEEKTA